MVHRICVRVFVHVGHAKVIVSAFYICVRVFVHVGHAKVIVSARAPLSYDVWLCHRRGPMITI